MHYDPWSSGRGFALDPPSLEMTLQLVGDCLPRRSNRKMHVLYLGTFPIRFQVRNAWICAGSTPIRFQRRYASSCGCIRSGCRWMGTAPARAA